MTYLHLPYSELLLLVSCSEKELSKRGFGTVKNDQCAKNVDMKPFSSKKKMSIQYGQKRPESLKSLNDALSRGFS